LDEYGAFDISLINDLPLFIDPFLLFNSEKPEYQALHSEMIRYLSFLRDKSLSQSLTKPLISAWYSFPEFKQGWLGFSKFGNSGRGLGRKFAFSLYRNLNSVFSSFGRERIARGSHIEKLGLIDDGIGKDKISDFTANLIKQYLLEFTQTFAVTHLTDIQCARVAVPRVRFNYEAESWVSSTFTLPVFKGDYVVLTPKDILTKDENWINRPDLFLKYSQIVDSMPNDQLRAQLNNYLKSVLPKDPNTEEQREAIAKTIRRYPEFLEYYIRYKEDHGDEAVSISEARVAWIEKLFVQQISQLANTLLTQTDFYALAGDTLDEARRRALFLKDVVENKGGWRLFYVDKKPVRREEDLHILYRLTWYATPSDISREVNDGRGPADFKASRGSVDKSIIEFKLASNTKLKRNLEKQVEIYKLASDADKGLKVIFYFTETELTRVTKILNDLGIAGDANIILVDARDDNKPSASVA